MTIRFRQVSCLQSSCGPGQTSRAASWTSSSFPDDAACLDYLAASRWPEGFRCPACGNERAWVLERRHLWECS
ncbi:MAG: transposase, partial [Solirubrobacterales bacterium]